MSRELVAFLLTAHSSMLATNFQFSVFHFQLFLGVPAIAVGLSAISLLVPLSLHSQRMPLQSLTLWGCRIFYIRILVIVSIQQFNIVI